jgi:PleD family two-component response regulator
LRAPDRPAGKPRSARETKQTTAPRVNISISIGLAERSKRHSTPELVLDAADATVYRAKEAGRNCLKIDECTPSAFAVEK